MEAPASRHSWAREAGASRAGFPIWRLGTRKNISSHDQALWNRGLRASISSIPLRCIEATVLYLTARRSLQNRRSVVVLVDPYLAFAADRLCGDGAAFGALVRRQVEHGFSQYLFHDAA